MAPKEHARSNVKLTRPAHDRWGISKVVFIYSDDFMKKVYVFPWFRDARWREVSGLGSRLARPALLLPWG